MKIRNIVIVFLFISIICIGSINNFKNNNIVKNIDIIKINDIVERQLKQDSSTSSLALIEELDTLVMEHLTQINKQKDKMMTIIIMTTSSLIILFAAFLVYIYFRILRPFNRLQSFAGQVATGDLSVPIQMDRNNIFGAFSESFDLMREELKRARENERMVEQSKKELIASLSHDIKTPVASIKAVSELMAVKSNSTDEIKQLEIINAKADQINTLITNMFNASLEELQELKVSITPHPSSIIVGFIKSIDYNHVTTITNIPECIIMVDPLRLQQIIDNIISNSYKYTNSAIDIQAEINNEFLEIAFYDYGQGVKEEEISHLFNKYFRANNATGKSGSGLGLYISKFLMNKMYGEITCGNTENGFCVKIKLKVVR